MQNVRLVLESQVLIIYVIIPNLLNALRDILKI